MQSILIILLLVILVIGIIAVIFLLLRKKDDNGSDEKMITMMEKISALSEQNRALRNSVDNKLAETHKTTQEHFGKTAG
ncbi:hypothetical protein KAJ61_00995, partial [Candidatus Parcubacteria bacterium]|nr:hypothetical protein [Candidatus Parcubacteria bacterium]